MNRVLKRVPLDFDYPLNKVWYGYRISHITTCHSDDKNSEEHCSECLKMALSKGIEISAYKCPCFDDYFQDVLNELERLCEPPTGDGYQLWETAETYLKNRRYIKVSKTLVKYVKSKYLKRISVFLEKKYLIYW